MGQRQKPNGGPLPRCSAGSMQGRCLQRSQNWPHLPLGGSVGGYAFIAASVCSGAETDAEAETSVAMNACIATSVCSGAGTDAVAGTFKAASVCSGAGTDALAETSVAMRAFEAAASVCSGAGTDAVAETSVANGVLTCVSLRVSCGWGAGT